MPKIMLNSVEYTGGGGDNGMELTYDEYLALPEEEKTNGTTYYIKDVNGIGGDQFQPIIYSEEEREIGVWTDGKPLYQKTTSVTPGNTISMVGLSLKHAQCYSINTSGGIASAPYNDGLYTVWWMSDDAIRFATQHNISQYVITYQYTKDSDQPGSGTWTPQGVPAVHYSTNEHVVGTWINGKTIYEQTISFTAPSNNYITIPTNITNFNKCIGYSGIVILGSGIFEDINYSRPDSNNSTYYTAITATGDVFFRTYEATTGTVYITMKYTKSTS